MTIDDWIWTCVAASIAGAIGILWFGARADDILEEKDDTFFFVDDRK